MPPNVYEKNGAVYLVTSGGKYGPKHRGMTVEDAEEFLQELEAAIEEAKAKQEESEN